MSSGETHGEPAHQECAFGLAEGAPVHGVPVDWATNAPLLARVLDQDAYPLATRVGTAAGTEHGSAHDPDHAYHFGLVRLLDGLAALIDTNR